MQSVALRLVAEREAEIEAHVPREYWSVAARLRAPGGAAFDARLVQARARRLWVHGVTLSACALVRVCAERRTLVGLMQSACAPWRLPAKRCMSCRVCALLRAGSSVCTSGSSAEHVVGLIQAAAGARLVPMRMLQALRQPLQEAVRVQVDGAPVGKDGLDEAAARTAVESLTAAPALQASRPQRSCS